MIVEIWLFMREIIRPRFAYLTTPLPSSSLSFPAKVLVVPGGRLEYFSERPKTFLGQMRQLLKGSPPGGLAIQHSFVEEERVSTEAIISNSYVGAGEKEDRRTIASTRREVQSYVLTVKLSEWNCGLLPLEECLKPIIGHIGSVNICQVSTVRNHRALFPFLKASRSAVVH